LFKTVKNFYKLSLLQKAILDTELLYPKLMINNISVCLSYNYDFDYNKINNSLNYIIQNTDILKIKIIKKNNDYFQQISEYKYYNFLFFDLKDKKTSQTEILFKLFGEKKINFFDEKLYDFVVVKDKYKTHIFIKFHHIISDSWTCFLFEKRLFDLLKNKNVEISDNKYFNYLEEEKKYLKSENCKSDTIYWKRTLSVLSSINEGKDNFFRYQKRAKNNQSKRIKFNLNKTDVLHFREFIKKYHISEYEAYLSVYSILVKKIYNKDKFIISTPVYNRKNKHEKETFGLFVNTLPLLIEINEEKNFFELASELKSRYKELLKHSRIPNYQIIDKILQKNKAANLFSIFFSYENKTIDHNDLKTTHFFGNDELSVLSIHISKRDNAENLTIEIDYMLNYFTENEVINSVKIIKNIVSDIYNSPSAKIKNIKITSDAEQKQILEQFNKPLDKKISQKTIVDYFIEKVKVNSNNLAVIDNSKSLSYKELNEKSNAFANFIIKNKKLNKQSKIAFSLRRKAEAVVCLMGIFKAGCVAVPINFDLPQKRKEIILSELKPDIFISEDYITSCCKSIYYNDIQFNNKSFVNFSNFKHNATIYFTSGTTGKPKGVSLKHSYYSNLVETWQKLYFLNSYDIRLLQLANFSFDVFMGDFIKVFSNSGTMIIADEKQRIDVAELADMIKKYDITILESTPTLIIPFFKYAEANKTELESLKTVIFGADSLMTKKLYELVKKYEHINFYNSYGVTETTIESTAYLATKQDKYRTLIAPIGRPLDNVHIYILNSQQQILPPEIEGDLYISGYGVPAKYFNDKILTSDKFFPNPFFDGFVMYKTGDRAKWLIDGNIEFIGRTDLQVKIAGNRIELKEIEFFLKEIDFVVDAAVVFDEKIYAFIVSSYKTDELQIKNILSASLPEYSIPHKYIFVEKIPLNSNGKVNSTNLLKILHQKTEKRFLFQKLYKNEKIIKDVIVKLIGSNSLDKNDNLFDSGFNSLMALEASVLVQNKGLNISAQDFYNYPTISQLAKIQKNINDKQEPTKNKNYEPKTKIISIRDSASDNIVLTGVTGFFGIHLLHKLAFENKNIHCLVRKKDEKTAFERLSDTYFYYFDSKLPENIEVVETETNDKDFGLSKLNNLDVKYFIHCASNVRQMGNWNELEQDNIHFTQKVAQFCSKNKIELHYISTMSIGLKTDKVFDETTRKCFVHKFENPYIYSKYRAEEIIRKTKELNFKIYRIGNLTGRFSDGRFQINEKENLFYQLLEIISNQKILPETILKSQIEFTPVDLAAEAFYKLFKFQQKTIDMYHIFNNSTLKLKDFCKITNNKFKFLPYLEFKQKMQNNPLILAAIDYFANYSNDYKKFSNAKTLVFLKKNDFTWTKPDKEYINKIIP